MTDRSKQQERSTEAPASSGTPRPSTPSTAPPPSAPSPDTNPAHGLDDKAAYAGKPDQEIKKTTGPGAGGATEWGGGNKNHPVRVKSRPPGAA